MGKGLLRARSSSNNERFSLCSSIDWSMKFLFVSDFMFYFRLSVVPLTATLVNDFENLTSAIVTYNIGEVGRKSVRVNISDDAIVEDDETFDVFISSLDSRTKVRASVATITILDDDCKLGLLLTIQRTFPSFKRFFKNYFAKNFYRYSRSAIQIFLFSCIRCFSSQSSRCC